MKFLKYQHKWAYGNSEWEYKFMSIGEELDEDLLEEELEKINHLNSWSDKYRGINYEVVDYPGHDWMKQNIKHCKDTINYTTKLLGEYNALYYKNDGN